MTRSALAVAGAVAALALVVSACGGEDGGAASSKSATATATVPAAGSAEARYAAIEAVLEAEVPLDELEEIRVPSHARADALMRPVLRACTRLDPADPLLRALRDACRDGADFFHDSLRPLRCRAELEVCAQLFVDMRAALKDVVISSRAADRAVSAAAIPAACKRALRTPAVAYTFYRRRDARLKRLTDAIAFGFMPDVQKALLALVRLDDDGLPKGRESLKKFRAGCR